MPTSPIYLDLNVVEKSLLRLPISTTISGTLSMTDGNGSVDSFLSREERRQISKLLKLYRDPLNQNKLTSATFNALGLILRRLIGSSRKLGDFSSLLLRVKPDYMQFITNIPWELAALSTIDETSSPDFSLLLADRPFARTIEGYNSLIPDQSDAKLRVHYCISDPQGNLQANDFKNDLDTALRERSAYIDVRVTRGPDFFKPLFDSLLIDIDQYSPDIFIIACHGRSSSGIPQVLFNDEWKPVESIAKAIKNTKNNSLVILIACDLTYASESLPSHSGAVTFIEKGIPSVIAIQSSIMVKCGRILLDGVINYLFGLIQSGVEDGTLLRALSYTRRRIFESLYGSSFTNLDWSYPALFVSLGNVNGLGKMRYWQLGYVSALRNIRAKNFILQSDYFPRPNLEQQLIQFFQTDRIGVCSIGGPSGSGKSCLLNYAGDLYYRSILEENRAYLRHLVYIDFNEEERTLSKVIELFNVINSKIEAISPSSIAVKLVQKLRLSSNGSAEIDIVDRVIQEMDQKKAIYIFDNLDQQQYHNLLPILKLAQHDFRDSLIIVPGHTNDFQNMVDINHLSQDETIAYILSLGSGLDSNAAFLQTGGNFGSLRLIEMQPGTIEPALKTQDEKHERIINSLSDMGDNYLKALCILAQFEKGLSKDLLEYTTVKWEELEVLRNLGAVASRLNEVNCEVVFIPKIIRKYVSDENPPLVEYGRNVFLEEFDKFPSADPGVFNKILALQGGFDFILTMMRLEKENFDLSKSVENLDHIRAMLYLTYEPLYASSRWGLALELIQLHNYSIAPDLIRAIDWINEAKTAEVLGIQDLMRKCINNAEQKELSTIEKVMLLQLKAGLGKISGNLNLLPEMIQQYKEAEQLILSLEENTEELREGYTLTEIIERKGILYHNRAIIHHWWAKNEEAAFSDIQGAIKCFQQAKKPVMVNMSLSEFADMRINSAKTSEDFDNIIRDLIVTRNFFSGNQITGDLATVYLRLARVYKRYAELEKANRVLLMEKALNFYEETAVTSNKAGMQMQELIALGHINVLKGPGFLNKFSSPQTIQKLDEIIAALSSFSSHSWARRNIRNLNWQKAQLTDPKDKAGMLSVLFTALKDAININLHNKSKTDTGIAVQLIYECLAVIGNDIHNKNEFIVGFRDAIKNWFGFADFSTIEELQQLIQDIHPIKPYHYG
jgi:hypothetical protein